MWRPCALFVLLRFKLNEWKERNSFQLNDDTNCIMSSIDRQEMHSNALSRALEFEGTKCPYSSSCAWAHLTLNHMANIRALYTLIFIISFPVSLVPQLIWESLKYF